jgi:putative tricarboxylic transport membrane protein
MLQRLLLPTAIATLLLAATAIIFAGGAVRLGFWTEDGPGPGLLPFATTMLLLPLLVLVLRERVTDEEPFRAAPLAAILLTCVYAAALPYLGFLLPTLVLIVAWVRLFHTQGWIRAVTLSIALTAAGTVLFAVLLKVPMPLFPAWS